MTDLIRLPTSPRQERAAAALRRIERLSGGELTRPAKSIAHTVADAVREAVNGAVPYGRSIAIEMDVAHQDTSGSTTTARLRVRCGGRDDA